MKSLENSIDVYLSNKTEYAIQITGNWGTGKTYHYKNILEDVISKKPTIKDARKNYKPLYISLFGINSVEDIETKIVFDFFQSKYFKGYKINTDTASGKVLALTEGAMNIALRRIMNFHKLGNAKDYQTDIKNTGRKVLDTSELVICFDDMERKSPKLEIGELVGYINSLVDEGVKILIISNDDVLKKQTGDLYNNIKEKLIGISLEFHPNISYVLANIIKLRYSGQTSFQTSPPWLVFQ